MTRINFLLVSASAVLLASALQAQVVKVGDENSAEPPTYKMTVSAAAEPRPALNYHILVPPVDQVEGNAATYYYKSMVFEEPDWVYQLSQVPLGDKVEKWLETPLDKLPIAEIKKEAVFVVPGSQWQPLQEASRCNHCDWGDPIREDGISTLLPQTQKMRAVATGLALKARMQLAGNKCSDAIDTLRLGYSLSRNLGHGCCLVQSLVGIAIASVLNEQTLSLMAVENSPNLYWALTELAAEPVDLRQAMSYETKVWEFTVHDLGNLERSTLTQEEATALVDKVYGLRRQLSRLPGGPKDSPDKDDLLNSLQEAKTYLLEHGYTAEHLKLMPDLQLAMLYRWKQYSQLRDDYFKWCLLPDDEALQSLNANREHVEKLVKQGVGQPFSWVLPGTRAFDHGADAA